MAKYGRVFRMKFAPDVNVDGLKDKNTQEYNECRDEIFEKLSEMSIRRAARY